MAGIVNVLIPLTYLVFLAAEARWPARPQPRLRWWRLRGVVGFGLSGLVVTGTSVVVGRAARAITPLDVSRLGAVAGVALSLVVASVAQWLWHSTQHRTPWLWRLTHQLHHASERVDLPGAFVSHPLDMASVGAVLGGASGLLHVSPAAAAIASYLGFVMAVVQHANLRTPRWLGYVVQRPESHCVHHERGVHAFNYADLPLVDLVFGTFRNPAAWSGKAGFYDGASARVGAMLVGVDVNHQAQAMNST